MCLELGSNKRTLIRHHRSHAIRPAKLSHDIVRHHCLPSLQPLRNTVHDRVYSYYPPDVNLFNLPLPISPSDRLSFSRPKRWNPALRFQENDVRCRRES
jgi:hypothetical protein